MTPTYATPANMRDVAEAVERSADGFARRAIAYSPTTGEQYSADAGDYWNQADDAPLRDAEGEPMVLVFERTTMVDALTDELV